ncbi:excalibur calcium-binding domain-containing protein [Cellulomonas fimi]|uniref:excalibur calcium-binding domain-containing protein n=1 Tax=Cellulomonas fimi TaxID=1708 RepID=UPI00234CCB10|nr:excalibur calcium-binding domain-containing protein [Cellulomonas fimi]MDC7122671.1 excalibur calcium-binding domain-containing protein [Cellulomonas fimi]
MDGDTFEAKRGGDEIRVRLAGVVAPDGDECLADESADALSELLGEDTKVRLEVVDGSAAESQEVVARVFVEDEDVAAALVGRGLARVDPEVADEEYRTILLDALERSRADEEGAFDESVECTLPAQLAAFEEASEDAVAAAAAVGVGAGVDAVDTRARALAAAAATGEALAALLDGTSGSGELAWYDDGFLDDLRSRAGSQRERVGQAIATNDALLVSEKARVEAERLAAEEAARAAAEAEAARLAEEARQAEAARLAQEAADAAAAAAESEPTGGGASAYYGSCADARAAGAAPLYAGEPGYRSGLDRDKDGVACE